MITIKAKSENGGVTLETKIEGTGAEIVEEATVIMGELPNRIKETSKGLFFQFLASLMDSGAFDIKVGKVRDDD